MAFLVSGGLSIKTSQKIKVLFRRFEFKFPYLEQKT